MKSNATFAFWGKLSQQQTENCHLAGLIFSTVAAQSSHTTSKCSIARLRSLAEVACVNPKKRCLRLSLDRGVTSNMYELSN
jgi:hypothetical protein